MSDIPNPEPAPKADPAVDSASDHADELRASAERIWLAGLGALAVAEEEGSKLFRNLVERGESARERLEARTERVKQERREVRREAKATVEEGTRRVRRAGDDLADAVERRVNNFLERLGVPGRDEIQRLTRRVEELNAKLVRMERMPSAADPSGAPSASDSAAATSPNTPPPTPAPAVGGDSGAAVVTARSDDDGSADDRSGDA